MMSQPWLPGLAEIISTYGSMSVETLAPPPLISWFFSNFAPSDDEIGID